MSLPENVSPELRVGQSIVRAENQGRGRLFIIAAVDAEHVTLRTAQGETRTLSRNELAAMLTDPALTVHATPDVTSPVVPSMAQRRYADALRLVAAQQKQALTREIGPRRAAVFQRLMERRSELLAVRGQLQRDLETYRDANGGLRVSRLAAAAVRGGGAREAEAFSDAPQRKQIARVDAALREVEQGANRLRAGQGFDFTPRYDDVVMAMAQADASVKPEPRVVDVLRARVGTSTALWPQATLPTRGSTINRRPNPCCSRKRAPRACTTTRCDGRR